MERLVKNVKECSAADGAAVGAGLVPARNEIIKPFRGGRTNVLNS